MEECSLDTATQSDIFFEFWLIGREAVTRLYLIIVAPAPVALELLGYVRISQQFFGTLG